MKVKCSILIFSLACCQAKNIRVDVCIINKRLLYCSYQWGKVESIVVKLRFIVIRTKKVLSNLLTKPNKCDTHGIIARSCFRWL